MDDRTIDHVTRPLFFRPACFFCLFEGQGEGAAKEASSNLKLGFVENVFRKFPRIVAILVDADNHRHALLSPVVRLLLHQV